MPTRELTDVTSLRVNGHALEVVPFAGRPNNVRLVCNQTELIVTLDVGPRIISYGKVGGPNMFLVTDADSGIPTDGAFHGFGGHRLWIAPEENDRTLQPDNAPVKLTIDEGWFAFTCPVDRFHIQKELRVQLDPELDRVVIDHRIYNHSPYDLPLAPWVLTQLSSGETIIPQPEFIPHEEYVVAARPLVQWHFTKLSDPRWTWGDHVIRLRHDAKSGPQKIGTLVTQGYAAAANEGSVLFKRFPCVQGGNYTDFGCNYETFTRHDMLEIETLGLFEAIRPGQFASHRETWYLIPDQVPPTGDEACGRWLSQLAKDRPL